MSLFSYSFAFLCMEQLPFRSGGLLGLTSPFGGHNCPPSQPLEPQLHNNLSNQSVAIKFSLGLIAKKHGEFSL